MSKLFSQEEVLFPSISTEDFVSYHKVTKVVATEAVKDFFSQVKDTLANGYDRLLDPSKEKVMIDASSSKYEVLNICKRIETAHIAHELVITPERFKGQYTKYLEDLVKASEDMVPDTIKLLENIKLAVAGFVNEYSEDGVLSIYGVAYAKTSEGKRKKYQSQLAKYFPHTKTTSKANAKEVVRSVNDMKFIYDRLPMLSASISQEKLEHLQKLTKDVSDMVDVLIDQNSQSGIMVKNSGAKQDLVDILHIGAKNVEFCGYLHANAMQFYTAVRSLSDVIIKVGNR